MIKDTTALVIEASAGGHTAFENLLDKTRGPVFRILCRILADPGWAEEAAQDVYVAAYQGMARLRAPDRFRSWVYGIADRIGRNLLRRRRRMKALPPDMTAPGRNADAAETVARALEAVSEEHREALLLRYHEGLSLREAADRMKRTTDAMKSLMFRARESFVKALKTE